MNCLLTEPMPYRIAGVAGAVGLDARLAVGFLVDDLPAANDRDRGARRARAGENGRGGGVDCRAVRGSELLCGCGGGGERGRERN